MPRHCSLAHRATHAVTSRIYESSCKGGLSPKSPSVLDRGKSTSKDRLPSSSSAPPALLASLPPSHAFPLSFLYPPFYLSSSRGSGSLPRLSSSPREEKSMPSSSRNTHTFSFISNTSTHSQLQPLQRRSDEQSSNSRQVQVAGPSRLAHHPYQAGSVSTQTIPGDLDPLSTLKEEPLPTVQHLALCGRVSELDTVEAEEVARIREALRAQVGWSTSNIATVSHQRDPELRRAGRGDALPARQEKWQLHSERLYLPVVRAFLQREAAASIPAAVILIDMLSHLPEAPSPAASWAISRTLEMCICVSENGDGPVFRSEQHKTAADQLWLRARRSGWEPDRPTWTRYSRAVLAAGLVKEGAQLFAEQVRTACASPKALRQPGEWSKPAMPSRTLLSHLRAQLRRLAQAVEEIQRQSEANRSRGDDATLSELGSALAELASLLEKGLLPYPLVGTAATLRRMQQHQECIQGKPQTSSIAWLISRLVRFDQLARATFANRTFDASMSTDVASIGHDIRASVSSYLQRFGDGNKKNCFAHPPLDTASYNSLVNYALDVLRDHSLCLEIVKHMAYVREPPLPFNDVMRNTILTHATRYQLPQLANTVLRRSSERAVSIETPSTRSGMRGITDTASRSQVPSISPTASLLMHLAQARARSDTHRIVALLQHIASSRWTRFGTQQPMPLRHHEEPGRRDARAQTERERPSDTQPDDLHHPIFPHHDAKRFVFLVLPELDLIRPFRRRGGRGKQMIKLAILRGKYSSDSPIRSGEYPASRDPYVLTAALNVSVKAGHTHLASRIWALMKRKSRTSTSSGSPMNGKIGSGGHIPLQAATLLMQLCIDERNKGMSFLQQLTRNGTPLRHGPKHMNFPQAIKQYAHRHPRHFRWQGWSPTMWHTATTQMRQTRSGLRFRSRVTPPRPSKKAIDVNFRRNEPSQVRNEHSHENGDGDGDGDGEHMSAISQLLQLRALVAVRVAAREYAALRIRWRWVSPAESTDERTGEDVSLPIPSIKPDAYFFGTVLGALEPPKLPSTRRGHKLFQHLLGKAGVDWLQVIETLQGDMVAHGFGASVPPWVIMALQTARGDVEGSKAGNRADTEGPGWMRSSLREDNSGAKEGNQ